MRLILISVLALILISGMPGFAAPGPVGAVSNKYQIIAKKGSSHGSLDDGHRGRGRGSDDRYFDDHRGRGRGSDDGHFDDHHRGRFHGESEVEHRSRHRSGDLEIEYRHRDGRTEIEIEDRR